MIQASSSQFPRLTLWYISEHLVSSLGNTSFFLVSTVHVQICYPNIPGRADGRHPGSYYILLWSHRMLCLFNIVRYHSKPWTSTLKAKSREQTVFIPFRTTARVYGGLLAILTILVLLWWCGDLRFLVITLDSTAMLVCVIFINLWYCLFFPPLPLSTFPLPSQ